MFLVSDMLMGSHEQFTLQMNLLCTCSTIVIMVAVTVFHFLVGTVYWVADNDKGIPVCLVSMCKDCDESDRLYITGSAYSYVEMWQFLIVQKMH
jgi:thiamine transporter ThiT